MATTTDFTTRHILTGHKKAVSSVKFSPDGNWLVSASNDKTFRLWDIEGRHVSSTLAHESGISDVAWSPDGSFIASASDDTFVHVWDYKSGQIMRTLKGHTNFVMCVNVHPEGRLVATGSFDSTARIWSVDSGECIHRLSAHEDMVVSAHFDPEGSKLLTAGFDGYVRVWDVNTGALLANFLVADKKPVCFAKWSPNGKYILAGCFDGTWKLINGKTGLPARIFTGHNFNDYCIFASFLLTGGKRIISGSADDTVSIWDINSTKLLQRLEGHTDVVVAVDGHHSSEIIASGGLDKDKTVRIWKSTIPST